MGGVAEEEVEGTFVWGGGVEETRGGEGGRGRRWGGGEKGN